MARRTDRRVQRTRKSLQEALMALILEEGYDVISILDITEKANLGRATFYLHFKDKDELLLSVLDDLMASFFDQVPQLSEAHWGLDDLKAIEKLFNFAAEHYDLYRILIFGSGGIMAARQLHRNIAKNIETCIQKEVKEREVCPVIPPDFIANHFAGALLATIYWWLDHDLPYDAADMAAMFQKINQLDREAMMGLNSQTLEELPASKKEKKKRRGREKNPQNTEQLLSDEEAEEAVGEEAAATPEENEE